MSRRTPAHTPRAPASRHGGSRYGGACPVSRALGAVGGKWAAPVLGRLSHGPARFNALRLAVQGVREHAPSAKVLAAELRRLRASGVIVREAPADRPTRYALTDRGRALIPILDALGRWAESPTDRL